MSNLRVGDKIKYMDTGNVYVITKVTETGGYDLRMVKGEAVGVEYTDHPIELSNTTRLLTPLEELL